MVPLKVFTFGAEKPPRWFLKKVVSGDVKYVYVAGRVVACKFLDTNNKERAIALGELISTDMLYSNK